MSSSYKDKTDTRTWPIDVRITSSYELFIYSDSSAQIAYWQFCMPVCTSNRYLQCYKRLIKY